MKKIGQILYTKHYQTNWILVFPIGLVGITLLSVAILSSASVEGLVGTLQVNVQTACTMGGGSDGSSSTGGTYW